MLQRFVRVVMLAVLLYCPLSMWAEAGNAPVEMNIQVGEQMLTATLVENSTTAALIELLQKGPITINMHDYAGMEKVGALPTSLPRNDESINAEAGDLILYQGNQFVIYYDTNSWSLTRIGKINDITQQALKDILGSGDVTAILSVGEIASTETSQAPTEADDFIFVEGGAFRMGSPEEEPEREADEILHDVTVASFYIAPREVTQAEYSAVTGINPSYHQDNTLPAENVTWYEAIQYCNALSLEAGLIPCYTLDGKISTLCWNVA